MSKEPIEVVVRHLVATFVDGIVRLAREQLEAELRGLSFDEEGPSSAGATARAPRGAASGRRALARMVAPDPVKRVHAADHVEQMIRLVQNHPWPPRSAELQFLLGVKKDPFLRIAELAIATGRVRREGYKAGVKYFMVDEA